MLLDRRTRNILRYQRTPAEGGCWHMVQLAGRRTL